MNQTDSIKELATALAKAQAKIKIAVMDKTNPHFKSKYASLASVHDACLDALSSNGLSVAQGFLTQDGHTYLETKLMHSSGEWLSSCIKLVIDRQNMQGFASATTYARRIGLSSMVGVVADEDDDCEAATDRSPETKTYHKPLPAEIQVRGTSPTDAQIKRLYAICKENGWSQIDLKSYIKEMLGIDSVKNLTWLQYENLCKTISATPKTHLNDAAALADKSTRP
jgi:hypothetical protein